MGARKRHRSLKLGLLVTVSKAALLASAIGFLAGTSKAQTAQHHGSKSLSPEIYSREMSDQSDAATYRGFGRLFPLETTNSQTGHKPQPSPIYDLRALGRQMVEPREWANFPERFGRMPAGYTFFGQFIDHDITLDTVSKLDAPLNSSALENARTVDLDLDCVYGGGPERMPFLYNMPYLRIGKKIDGVQSSNDRHDLLRAAGNNQTGPQGGAARALIGDPRNDENFVVSQLQAAFIAYHNRLVDKIVEIDYGKRRAELCNTPGGCKNVRELAANLPGDLKQEVFEKARNHAIHYYHRIIAEDFLPRLIGTDRADDIRRNGRNFYFAKGFRKGDGTLEVPYIPFAFSVAAYRYGHGQVRQIYQIREGKDAAIPLFRGPQSQGGQRVIPGFGPITSHLAVDWRYFFGIDQNLPAGFNFASKITPFLPRFLHDLANVGVTGKDEVSLAARNLNRGRIFKLPSGQSVADAVLPVLQKRGVLKPWAVLGSRPEGWQAWRLQPDALTIRLLGNVDTPLWYYILQEAAATNIYRDQVEVAAKESLRTGGLEPRVGLPARFTMVRQVSLDTQAIQETKKTETNSSGTAESGQINEKGDRINVLNQLLLGDDSSTAQDRQPRRKKKQTTAKTQNTGTKRVTRPLSGRAYLRAAGGSTLGPVGGTVVGEVLFGLLEHYREKTGKGLDYVPSIAAQPTKGNVLPVSNPGLPPLNAPLTATRERFYDASSGAWRNLGVRYQMRNMLYDAGVAHSVTVTAQTKESAGGPTRR